MKISLIGSTSYQEKFNSHQNFLIKEGHEVKVPAFDNPAKNELEVCKYNRDNIEWADEVHVIWDNRSIGTIFDMGMVFALKKPIRIIYINPRTFENVIRLYEEESKV